MSTAIIELHVWAVYLFTHAKTVKRGTASFIYHLLLWFVTINVFLFYSICIAIYTGLYLGWRQGYLPPEFETSQKYFDKNQE